MGHRKEKDYEVAEVEMDVWTCDFCGRDVEKESNIHVFVVDPKITFHSRKTTENLVWLNKLEGKTQIEKGTRVSGVMEGHICDECVDGADLSIGKRFHGTVIKCLRKLKLR